MPAAASRFKTIALSMYANSSSLLKSLSCNKCVAMVLLSEIVKAQFPSNWLV
jgi:hypothetical protein